MCYRSPVFGRTESGTEENVGRQFVDWALHAVMEQEKPVLVVTSRSPMAVIDWGKGTWSVQTGTDMESIEPTLGR